MRAFRLPPAIYNFGPLFSFCIVSYRIVTMCIDMYVRREGGREGKVGRKVVTTCFPYLHVHQSA